MTNIINEPTRITDKTRTLLDPIAITNIIEVHDSGIFVTPDTVSDHFGTYAHITLDFQPSPSSKRRVWNYKRADFTKMNNVIRTTNWEFLYNGNIAEAFQRVL